MEMEDQLKTYRIALVALGADPAEVIAELRRRSTAPSSHLKNGRREGNVRFGSKPT